MKVVSFKVAKALKEAGYPQRAYGHLYLTNSHLAYGALEDKDYYAPTYLDVWLWLSRKTDLRTHITPVSVIVSDYRNNGYVAKIAGRSNDPEEAIIAAIDYLVDNDLIK